MQMRWIALNLGLYLLLPSRGYAERGFQVLPEDTKLQRRGDAYPEFDLDKATSSHKRVPDCTVNQLLPNPKNGAPGGWKKETGEHSPLYNCSCPYYKALCVRDLTPSCPRSYIT